LPLSDPSVRKHMKCRKFAVEASQLASKFTLGVLQRIHSQTVLTLTAINLVTFTGFAAAKPAAPANLAASALSSSAIRLTWQDRSSIESGFKLDRALSSSGPWTIN